MSRLRRLGPSAANTRSAILDLVRSSGTVSRIELAEMTGLTQTSITRMVKILIDAGLVIETGFGDSTGGKRPSLLELNPVARVAVGLSLDYAQLSYVVTDLGGKVVGRLVTEGIGQKSPGEVVVRIADELTHLIKQLDIKPTDVVGVGVAGAGLGVSDGAERNAKNTDVWESFAVKETLEKATGFVVVRDNDAACAALGQFWVGRIPATQDFATLYMSDGFGLGLMTGGILNRGSSSNVGEIGHIVLDIDGPECWCGGRGCLEMLAAPRAVVVQALSDKNLANDLTITGKDRDIRHDFDVIAREAAKGEERCVALIDRSARFVAAAMLSVVNLLDLDRIYFAGPSFADAGAFYVRRARETINNFARTRGIHGVTVELSDPGMDASAIGAATLALQHVLTPHTHVHRGGLNSVSTK